MYEEIETASDLYKKLNDLKNIGIANVHYIDEKRLEQRRIDYLPVEIEKLEIHLFHRTLEGPTHVLVINDQFVLYAPYLIFPDDTDGRSIVVAYDMAYDMHAKYKFSLN